MAVTARRGEVLPYRGPRRDVARPRAPAAALRPRQVRRLRPGGGGGPGCSTPPAPRPAANGSSRTAIPSRCCRSRRTDRQDFPGCKGFKGSALYCWIALASLPPFGRGSKSRERRRRPADPSQPGCRDWRQAEPRPRPNGGREARAIQPGHCRFNRFKSLVDKRAGILHHSHIVPRAPAWGATRRLQRGMGGPRSRAGWDLPIRKTPRKEVVQWI